MAAAPLSTSSPGAAAAWRGRRPERARRRRRRCRPGAAVGRHPGVEARTRLRLPGSATRLAPRRARAGAGAAGSGFPLLRSGIDRISFVDPRQRRRGRDMRAGTDEVPDRAPSGGISRRAGHVAQDQWNDRCGRRSARATLPALPSRSRGAHDVHRSRDHERRHRRRDLRGLRPRRPVVHPRPARRRRQLGRHWADHSAQRGGGRRFCSRARALPRWPGSSRRSRSVP